MMMIDIDTYIKNNLQEEMNNKLNLAEGYQKFITTEDAADKMLYGVCYSQLALDNFNFNVAADIFEEMVNFTFDKKLFTEYEFKGPTRYLEASMHRYEKGISESLINKVTEIYKANRNNTQIKLLYLWYNFIYEGEYSSYKNYPFPYLNNIQIYINLQRLAHDGKLIASNCPTKFLKVKQNHREDFAWLYYLQIMYKGFFFIDKYKFIDAMKCFEQIPKSSSLFMIAKVHNEYAISRLTNEVEISPLPEHLDMSVDNPYIYRLLYTRIGTLYTLQRYKELDKHVEFLDNLPWESKDKSIDVWLSKYVWTLSLYRRNDESAWQIHQELRKKITPLNKDYLLEELYILRSYKILFMEDDLGTPELVFETEEDCFDEAEALLADNIINCYNGREIRFPFDGLAKRITKGQFKGVEDIVIKAMYFCDEQGRKRNKLKRSNKDKEQRGHSS